MGISPYYKSDNCELYQCDNLELLKSLPDNNIDLIYCDVLYGTGRNFKRYKDLKPERKIIEDHYMPRLIELCRVLKDTGCIYIQCDWHISHWIRCMMDDVFGYKNFINEIIWCYRSGGAGKKSFRKQHDNIYLYSKSKNYTFNRIKEKSYMSHKYGFSSIEEYYDVEENKYYVYSFLKDWVEENIVPNKSKDKVDYDTVKPIKLIERFIKASSNVGDVVADFYMGSGTTGIVSLNENRRFIGSDIEPYACEISKNRIEKMTYK